MNDREKIQTDAIRAESAALMEEFKRNGPAECREQLFGKDGRRYKGILRWARQQEHEQLALAFASTWIVATGSARLLSFETRFRELLDARQRHERARGGYAKAATHSTHKNDAKTLWRERGAGKHPHLFPNHKLAAECVRRWPKLKQSTIERKWIPKWEKEARTHPAS